MRCAAELSEMKSKASYDAFEIAKTPRPVYLQLLEAGCGAAPSQQGCDRGEHLDGAV